MLELDIKQKLYEKLEKAVYKELCKAGIEYVKLGESFVIGESEYKGLKIEIKVEVKKATQKDLKSG